MSHTPSRPPATNPAAPPAGHRFSTRFVLPNGTPDLAVYAARTAELRYDDAELCTLIGGLARLVLARNPDCPAGLLAEIAEGAAAVPFETRGEVSTEYWMRVSVRRAIAENPSTPGGALSRLAVDPERCVRLAAAGNPSTPEGVRVLGSLS